MKFGQLTEYNKGNTFLHVKNEAGRLLPDLSFFFFFLKALYEVKTRFLIYFGSPQLCIQ